MKKAVFITGPTSSGKSELAVYLAKKFNGEVINADSRQVYKFLDYGSGKVTSKEMKGINHHLFSIASPKKNYFLARWLKDAYKALNKIIKKRKLPIFCGGTILYLKALKEGWILPSVKPDYRLRRKLEKLSKEELIEKIKEINPSALENIDLNNKRRLIRRLEIIRQLGKIEPIKKNPQVNLLILAISLPWEELEKRIKERLEKRIPFIIKEIKKLRKIGLSFKRIISFGLEYEWFGKFVLGEISLKEATEGCLKETRKFAKKQIRELKKINEVTWIKEKIEAEEKIDRFLLT